MKEISDIADVLELRVWASGADFTFGDLVDQIRAGIEVSELVDDDSDDEWSEDLAQEVIDEISTRRARLGEAYPFGCDGNRVWLEGEAEFSTYLYCVCLSTFPEAQITNLQRGVQFENIAMRAAGHFLNGTTLRIGAPWRTEEIATYADLLDRVSELIPELGPRTRDNAPGGGDSGWDFMVVKGFGDGEFPRVIAFGNCATGRTNWHNKGAEAQLGQFFSYFNHHHRSVVIEIFAVPFNMSVDDRLRKCGDKTLTFDRQRICENEPLLDAASSAWLISSRAVGANLALV